MTAGPPSAALPRTCSACWADTSAPRLLSHPPHTVRLMTCPAELTDLVRRCAAFAAAFDAGALDAPSCDLVLEQAASLEHMAATIKAVAAARVAASEVWCDRGHKTAPHYIAAKTGSSVPAAKEAVETANMLA